MKLPNRVWAFGLMMLSAAGACASQAGAPVGTALRPAPAASASLALPHSYQITLRPNYTLTRDLLYEENSFWFLAATGNASEVTRYSKVGGRLESYDVPKFRAKSLQIDQYQVYLADEAGTVIAVGRRENKRRVVRSFPPSKWPPPCDLTGGAQILFDSGHRLWQTVPSRTTIAEDILRPAQLRESIACAVNLFLGPAGNVWFTDESTGTLCAIQTGSSIHCLQGHFAKFARAAFCQRDKAFWIIDYRDEGDLIRMSLSGQETKVRVGGRPWRLACAANGVWYVSVIQPASVAVGYATSRGVMKYRVGVGVNPGSLVVDSDGSPWLEDYHTQALLKLKF